MKLFYYIEQVPMRRVHSEPCCANMKQHGDSVVGSRPGGMFMSSLSKDIPISYCPWCGTRILIHVDRDYDKA